MPYAAPPAKTEISATPSPSNAASKAGFGKLADWWAGLFGTTGKPAEAFAAMKLIEPKAIYNLKPTFSVNANALTITLKDKNTIDLSEDNPGFVSQRHATLGDGGFNLRKIAANISLVVSAGSMLGHVANTLLPVYIYGIDNDGVEELAVCGTFQGEVGIFTTTAEGGAGGADSATVMYSTTARAGVPGRLLAIAWFSQAVAGNWVNLPTEVRQAPLGATFNASAARGADCKNNAGTPNTQFDLDADELVLRNVVGDSVVRINPGAPITNNISTAGPAANGRDQAGAFSASSWVHFYWIWNGTTLATISSAAAPPGGPTMPTGYTHWAYAGAVFLDGGSALRKTYIKGATAFLQGHFQVASIAVRTSETAISLTSAVPPNALAVQCLLYNEQQGGAPRSTVRARLVTGVDFTASLNINTGDRDSSNFWAPNVGQSIILIGDNTDSGSALWVSAYTIPNGGE